MALVGGGSGWTLAVCAVLTACSRPSADGDGPANSGPELERGELLSFACQACHTLGADEPHRIGPNLHGVFGRTAATAPGFEYSDALRGSKIVWTPETLDRWLAAPTDFLPGTTMVFAGYANPDDRDALLEYLVHATGADADAH